jgi:hypothetical protein
LGELVPKLPQETAAQLAGCRGSPFLCGMNGCSELERIERSLAKLLERVLPQFMHSLCERFVRTGVVIAEESFGRKVLRSRDGRIGIGDFDVVEETNQMSPLD